MSLSTPPNGHGSPQPPPAYHYGPQGGEPNRYPQPTLPPMSSLLQQPLPQDYRPAPQLARQFLPPYNMQKQNPLTMSERDPTAPVHHIYYPAQLHNSHSPQNQQEPILVPNHEHEVAVSGQQVPQKRQFKKIVQRQVEPKDRPSKPTMTARHEATKVQSQPRDMGMAFTPSRQELAISEPTRRLSSQSQSSRSMPISGLLIDGPSPPPIEREQPKFTIRMRQQPLAARACGFGERDRRVIDPPPILQMDVDAPNATKEEMKALIRQPYAVVHCTLWDPVNDRDDTAMPGTTDRRQQRRLMGTLVASPFVGNDENDVEGCFFCFPDLSVRTPGTYSLRFKLVNLDPTKMSAGHSEPVRSTIKSSAFHVYNAKDFGGMRASTELTKKLKHQGCLISVKKGNAKSNGKNDRDEDDDDEDDEEDDAAEGSTTRKLAKRQKR